jgi:hypothetical protein
MPQHSIDARVPSPDGLPLEFAFPTGMRNVSAIDPTPTPWFSGINSAVGVFAASGAVLTSIAYGIDVTLAIGAICYLFLPALALSPMNNLSASPQGVAAAA